MKEKREKVARILKINEDTMESILNFIYTSEITVTKNNVCDVLKAADYFQIQSKPAAVLVISKIKTMEKYFKVLLFNIYC